MTTPQMDWLDDQRRAGVLGAKFYPGDDADCREDAPLRLVPVSFAEAAAFVDEHHRHHRRPRGHKFSLGVARGDQLVGVAMVGRPVARHLDDGLTLEVNRTATDGSRNANSMLYGAAWRATKALGFGRLITYTQQGESGASLRAAGWRVVAELPARKGWTTPARARDDRGTDGVQRTLWEAAWPRRKAPMKSGGQLQRTAIDRQPSAKATERLKEFDRNRKLALARDRDCRGPAMGMPERCRFGLHVHHIRPRGRGGSNDLDNLLTLCLSHHLWVHSNPEAAKEMGALR